MTTKPDVSHRNATAYMLIYEIETALREFFIEHFTAAIGPQWYKRALTGDALAKFREAMQRQRSIRWTDFVPHHPIYYLDFPHLRELIQKGDNWKGGLDRVFGRLTVTSATLEEPEPIRNTVAHNRLISPNQLELAAASHKKIRQLMGARVFDTLHQRSTVAQDIRGKLASLSQSFSAIQPILVECRPLTSDIIEASVVNEWWFDDDYLGADLEPVREYVNLLTAYCGLVRQRGDGYAVLAWLRGRQFENTFHSSLACLTSMLEQRSLQ